MDTLDTVSLNRKLDNAYISSDQLLWSVKLANNSSKSTAAFQDYRYLPFYYYLGQFVSPIRVVQIGCDGGLSGVAFLQSCKTVQEWCLIEADAISLKNLHQFCKDGVTSKASGLFDLALLPAKSSDFMASVEKAWKLLSPQGLLVVDYINVDSNNQKFHEFARVKNREAVIFSTRYGVGILER